MFGYDTISLYDYLKGFLDPEKILFLTLPDPPPYLLQAAREIVSAVQIVNASLKIEDEAVRLALQKLAVARINEEAGRLAQSAERVGRA